MTLKAKIGAFLRRKEGIAYFCHLREKAIHCRFYPVRRYYYSRYWAMMRKNGAWIEPACRMDSVPSFPHGFQGIFISEGAKIGKNCVILHQVTIGSNTLPDSPGRGCPTIGDNVFIGCGAKIIGNVHIGSNVRIGANCVVTRDVPDNATVVMERPRILLRQEARNNRYVRYDEMAASIEENC